MVAVTVDSAVREGVRRTSVRVGSFGAVGVAVFVDVRVAVSVRVTDRIEEAVEVKVGVLVFFLGVTETLISRDGEGELVAVVLGKIVLVGVSDDLRRVAVTVTEAVGVRVNVFRTVSVIEALGVGVSLCSVGKPSGVPARMFSGVKEESKLTGRVSAVADGSAGSPLPVLTAKMTPKVSASANAPTTMTATTSSF